MAITTLSIKDAAAATKTMAVVDTGSAVLAPANALVVGTTEAGLANPLPVMGRVAATIAPTMGTQTSGAYSANFFIDAKLTLANIVPVSGGSGTISNVKVLMKSVQTATFWVVFFNADPTSTTFTNNIAFSIADGDMTKIIGVATCAEVFDLGANSCHMHRGVGLTFKLASGTSAYAAVCTRAAITTTSTSDMILLVDVNPD